MYTPYKIEIYHGQSLPEITGWYFNFENYGCDFLVYSGCTWHKSGRTRLELLPCRPMFFDIRDKIDTKDNILRIHSDNRILSNARFKSEEFGFYAFYYDDKQTLKEAKREIEKYIEAFLLCIYLNRGNLSVPDCLKLAKSTMIKQGANVYYY